MVSRRDVLIGALAGAAALARRASLGAAAAQPSTPVSFAVPAGACDCHTHVFGDPRRFVFAAAAQTRRQRAKAHRQFLLGAGGDVFRLLAYLNSAPRHDNGSVYIAVVEQTVGE